MSQTGGAGNDNVDKMYCGLGCRYSVKIVPIGDWDMDTNESCSVAHGLTLANIREVKCLLRNDADDTYYQLCGHDGAAMSAQIDSIDATNVNIKRANGLDFDSEDFDSTSYNRGWITILYTN